MAMNDFNIGFIGGLDGTKSKAKLNQDIDAIKKTLKELELKAKLDPNQVKSLETQLNTLKVNLTDAKFSQSALDGMVSQINNALKGIKIPSVNVGGNTGQQIGNNITQGFKQSTNAIEAFRDSLSKVGKSTTEIDNIVKKVQGLNVQINSLRFSESTKGIMNVDVSGLDVLGNKVKIIQTLTQDLQDMQWKVSNTTTSVVSTKELERINNVFTDYTQKLAQFKSTNTNILSGLTQPLVDFESKLASLKNGTVSIDEVKNAFKLLGTEASKITENFTGQLSKTDAAIRKLAQGDEIMDKLKASFNGLSNTPQNISAELSRVSNLLQEVKRIETTEGRTSNWSAKYREWSDEVDKLQAKLSVLQKQQANVGTVQELANAMADVRAKSEQARQSEEKRQQIAQNNAINKALEQEYKERQKNIEAARKQAELDKQNALAFTKSASERLSSAISKYSYGDTSDANAMMKQMNRGLSNFGNLSNVQGNITQLSSTVDKIIADLKLSHEQSLQALNQEIKAEQTLQSQKDAFNKRNLNAIDYEIQKREQEAKAFSSMLQAQMQEQQKMQANVNKIQLLSNGGIKNDYATQIAKLEGDFRSLGLAQDTIATKTQNVKNSLATLRAEFAKPVEQQNFQAIQTVNDNLQRELIESRNEFEQLRASMKGMATEQQRLSLANTIEAWNQKNTAATKAVREENERYVISLRDLSNQMTRMDFNKINTGFKQNENSMRALNRLGASLKNQFTQAYQSFTMWLSASTMVMKVISETREAFAELKEVNTLLTEISKANENLSKTQLTKIADDGFGVASNYGKKITDYLSGVQEASRAGYENAEVIAELSTAIQGAGDVTSDIANKYVIATDKAYGLKGSVEELTKVFDGSNYITNKNAVNMTELADGMSIVGSTAASFGIGVNETTAALGTMIATTQQSGSEMARAFRAILLNIKQVSDEEEGIDAEGLTKYEKACNALGVSLKETRNGVLQTRDAMDVLKDLSVEYNKLEENDLKRVNLLNSVGGKLCHVIQKCITRMNLIAGNPLEPCTTI